MVLYELSPVARRGSGFYFLGVAGEAVVRGQLVYKAADGRWNLADADAVASMPTIGITLDVASVAGQNIRIMTQGFMGRSDWTWTTGGTLYASATAGALTQTAPVGAGDVVQIVGMATQTDQIHFDPKGEGATGGGGAQRDIWYPAPNPDGNIGTHAAVVLTDAVDIVARMELLIPRDFTTLVSANIVLVAGGAGNLRRTVATNWGAVCSTENYNTSTDAIAVGQVAVLANDLTCIDIAAALTAIAGNDLVGVEFTRSASNANDTVNANVYFLGILLRYT